MADAYPHLAERRDEILGVIEREERQFNRTLEAGVGLLEEALIPLTDAERVVGRQADALPADAPVLPGRRRVPAPRHLRLPDRPDRRARGRVRRAHGPRRLPGRARRAARAEPERHEGGPRAHRRARLAATTGILARTGADRVPGLRDDDRRGPRRRDPARRRRSTSRSRRSPRSSCGPRRARAPRSSSTARRSTRRAAARSPTPGGCSRADGSVLFDVEDVQRVAGTQTAGLTVHRGVLHGAVRVGDTVRAEVDAERRAAHDAQPHGHAPAPPRAAQRRRRAGAAGGLARARRTTSGSTSRSTAASPTRRSARSSAEVRGASSARTARSASSG